jgi:glycosyltransferase involved in cell wall biosynthesis
VSNRPYVLHVTQSCIGGTHEYLRLLLPRLREDYHIEVACPDDGPLGGDLAAAGFPVQRLAMRREVGVRGDLHSLQGLRALIARRRPALLHLHSSKAGVIGRLASLITGVPAVYTAHGWAFSMDVPVWQRCVYAFAEQLCAPLCRQIVNISESERQSARRWHIASDRRMTTIPNGIDFGRFHGLPGRSAARRQVGLPEHGFVVGMVARLAAQKDPATFVGAAARVAQEVPNACFVLVGDGPLRSSIEALVRRLGLADRIRLVGWQSDVRDWLAALDVAVLTSAWEGFGLSIAEYMAARVPVIASRVGGIPELVCHGATGLLVAPGDAGGFANAILELHRSPERRARFAEHAYAAVRREFDISRVAEAHRALYARLLGAGAAWHPAPVAVVMPRHAS